MVQHATTYDNTPVAAALPDGRVGFPLSPIDGLMFRVWRMLAMAMNRDDSAK